MLRQFSPDLFAGEIKVTRRPPGTSREQGGHRKAA
jgi:hypothetical protein